MFDIGELVRFGDDCFIFPIEPNRSFIVANDVKRVIYAKPKTCAGLFGIVVYNFDTASSVSGVYIPRIKAVVLVENHGLVRAINNVSKLRIDIKL